MKIAIIIGTRPEIIKMAPVIRECEMRNLEYFILHTGQHYSYNMDRLFFEQLGIKQPSYNLDVGAGSHAEQVGKIIIGSEKIIINENIDLVLVQGDTNTALGGALAAAKIHRKVGHIEAGLRSFDKNMPEEINRILIDRISDFLFAPNEKAKCNLLKEGILNEDIMISGNTIVDSIYQNVEIANRSDVLKNLRLKSKKYFLITAHREENVDNKYKIKEIISGINHLHNEYNIPILFPIHPRTKRRIEEFNINSDGIEAIEPLGYLEFLELEANARLILTDSGGVQEEACILGVPCVTLRETTEWTETLDVGSNMLVGADSQKIYLGAKKMLNKKIDWINPFGERGAGKKIVDYCVNV